MQESIQALKDTVSGKKRPAQGTRYVYAPLIIITIAFALSVLSLASCQFVIYYDPECDANPCTRTSGIYCYDSSLKEKIQNLFIGTIQKFVQVIGTGTAILGGIATLMLWKALKKPHGRCMFKLLAICVICCVPGQFITLSMLQSEFCWSWTNGRNFCSLGWGGNVSIASGCLWFVACIALCKVPKPIERSDETEVPKPIERSDETEEVAVKELNDEPEQADSGEAASDQNANAGDEESPTPVKTY